MFRRPTAGKLKSEGGVREQKIINDIIIRFCRRWVVGPHTAQTRDAARIVDLVRHELVWIRYPIDLWNNTSARHFMPRLAVSLSF